MAYYLATPVLMIVLIVLTALSSYGQVCSVYVPVCTYWILSYHRLNGLACMLQRSQLFERGCEDTKESHLHFLVAPV